MPHGRVLLENAEDAAVVVKDGRGLALAFANHSVTNVTIATSFRLETADWEGLGPLPLNLTRSLTIASTAESQQSGDWPAIDFNYVKDKVRLVQGVQLSFYYFVMTRYREDIPSSTPGIDLLANSDLVLSTVRPPLLMLDTVGINSRLCFQANLSRESILKTPRPSYWPGEQNETSDLPQAGCTNSSAAPWLKRCWAVRRVYYDVVTPGKHIGVSGRSEPTNYNVHVNNSPLLCSAVMPQDCIDKMGGAFACYYSIFPRIKLPPVPPAAPPILPPAPPPPDAPLVDDVGSQSPSRRDLAYGLAGGLISGGAAVAAAALAAFLGCRLRRGSQSESAYATKEPGSFNCGLPTLATTNTYHDPSESASDPKPVAMTAPDFCCGTQDLVAPSQVDGNACTVTTPQQQNRGLNQPLGAYGGGASARGMPGMLPVAATNSSAASADLLALSRGFSGQRDGSPVTEKTPPRPDMQLLQDHQTAAGNELVLLPGAVRGKGCFGRVVEGLYQGRRVAVKLVAEAHVWGGMSKSLLRSFAAEVEVLGRCDHPNVVRLLAACLTPPRLCLVMELCDTSLEGLMYRRPAGSGPLPLPLVLHIGTEVAKGLEYLHPTIVHRDLKPANVLLNGPLGGRPVVKIADFGLARLRVDTQSTETSGAGTPAYLAPEGFDARNHNHVITHKFDIYSLAVLLWEMLSGVPPWHGCAVVEVALRVVRSGARPPLGTLPAERCPQRLRELLQQCWEADPRRRPAAAEVVKRLTLVQQEMEKSGRDAARGAGASPRAFPAAAAAADPRPTRAAGAGGAHGPAVNAPRVLGGTKAPVSSLDSATAAVLADAAARVQPETIGATPAATSAGAVSTAAPAAAKPQPPSLPVGSTPHNEAEPGIGRFATGGDTFRVVAVGVRDMARQVRACASGVGGAEGEGALAGTPQACPPVPARASGARGAAAAAAPASPCAVMRFSEVASIPSSQSNAAACRHSFLSSLGGSGLRTADDCEGRVGQST